MLHANDVKYLLGHTLKDVEQAMVDAALEKTGYSVPATAMLLGLSTRTVWRRISSYMND